MTEIDRRRWPAGYPWERSGPGPGRYMPDDEQQGPSSTEEHTPVGGGTMAEYQCACGCGQVITKGQWAPGHDHRAIHSRIAEHHGNVANFIEWYDWAFPKVGAGPSRKKGGHRSSGSGSSGSTTSTRRRPRTPASAGVQTDQPTLSAIEADPLIPGAEVDQTDAGIE